MKGEGTEEKARKPGTFTRESAREARKLRGQAVKRIATDADIEARLRADAHKGIRGAASELRAWQRERKQEHTEAMTLASMEEMSSTELERYGAWLQRMYSRFKEREARAQVAAEGEAPPRS